MLVNFVPKNRQVELTIKGNRRLKDVLRELNVLPQTVLVIRGDELLTEQDLVSNEDTLDIRSVTSGG